MKTISKIGIYLLVILVALAAIPIWVAVVLRPTGPGGMSLGLLSVLLLGYSRTL